MSKSDIENKSNRLLTYFKNDFLDYVHPTPIKKIAAFLSEKHQVILDFEAQLGFSESGFRILGGLNIKKRIIVIDKALQSDIPKFNFTLAHELGHLALHRDLKIDYSAKDEVDEMDDTVSDNLFGGKKLRGEIEWVEWQANYYASTLLMPKMIFIAAIMNAYNEMGKSWRGKIYVDNQPCNAKDYYVLLNKLADFFGVSISAAEYRINDLNLIEDNRVSLIRSAINQISKDFNRSE